MEGYKNVKVCRAKHLRQSRDTRRAPGSQYGGKAFSLSLQLLEI